MRQDAKSLRSGVFYWFGGSPLVQMPRSDANPVVATCFIINAASLLDEGLEVYLSSHRVPGGARAKTLARRINILERAGILNNAASLHKLRELRNGYAHELDKYGDWIEFDMVHEEVEQTLQGLGLL